MKDKPYGQNGLGNIFWWENLKAILLILKLQIDLDFGARYEINVHTLVSRHIIPRSHHYFVDTFSMIIYKINVYKRCIILIRNGCSQ